MATEEGEVVEVGGAALLERDEVVGFAPAVRAVAAGEDAAAVADDEASALGGGGEAAGSADIEDLAAGIHEHSADGAVAGEPLKRRPRHRSCADDLAATQALRTGCHESRVAAVG